MRLPSSIILIILSATLALCENILVLLPMPFKSHTLSYMPIITELAARGHNVTFVSPYSPKEKHPNLKHVLVNDIYEKMSESFDGDLRLFNTWFTKLIDFWIFGPAAMELILKEEPIQMIIQDETSTYDLIILETYFIQEPFVALGYKYNAPVININNFELTSEAAAFTGNPYLVSYTPDFKVDATDHMSFSERLLNTITYIIETTVNNFYYIPLMDKFMRTMKFPGSENLPPITDLLRNTSLTLTDSHFSMGYPRPQHRNVVEFGGLSLKNAAELPKDIKNFMDGAKEGVVYTNFGTLFKMSMLKKEEIDGLFGALRKLKQRVILKWETPTLPVHANNIIYGDWLPQASILAHPNCKLFITHGGIHGIYEAASHGVPLLGFPMFADQSHNMVFVQSKGYGRVINEFKEETLLNEINAILSDKRYEENAKKMSKIIMDRPLGPLENAVYWVEYVLRHKGAPHLKPAVLDIPFYQYFLLDVIAFILISCIISLWVLRILCKIVYYILRVCFTTIFFRSTQRSGKIKGD